MRDTSKEGTVTPGGGSGGACDIFDPVQDIENFHTHFSLDYEGPPRLLPQDLEDFRQKFLAEEVGEYCTATTKADKLDALVDLVYVALGTAYLSGFDFREAWRRVHRANMLKVRRASERSSYDVCKPRGWVAPDLSDLVK